jgi:glycosyltransferase involved in cell wall biosynthesis
MVAAPAVLDLVDLEDHKISARMAIPVTGAQPGAAARARRAAAHAFSAEEVRRWRRLQRSAGGRVAATVVCSDLDAVRARAGGVPRVEVVPNAYRLVPDPVGRTEVGDPPVVLFQGTLRYPPNAEAARFLVREVVPRLVELTPGVQVRLVGTTAPGLAGLDDPPTVTLVGQVPDMADELAAADVVVVPLRFGSGTRLKVLEAFAQRVPVVSTSIGAEGLGAIDGPHLLIADTPADLAAACARVCADRDLRTRLADGGQALFLERFESGVARERIRVLVDMLTRPG